MRVFLFGFFFSILINAIALDPLPASADTPANSATLRQISDASPPNLVNSCPDDWTLSSWKGVSVFFEGNIADGFLLESPYAKLSPNVSGATYGGSAPQTFHSTAPGYLNADGVHFVHIGSIDLENGRQNIINILASGLASSPRKTLTVIGDVGLDIVYLDECLRWDAPVEAVSDGRTFLRYVAHDDVGGKASLSILKGLEVRSLAKWRIGSWRGELIAEERNWQKSKEPEIRLSKMKAEKWKEQVRERAKHDSLPPIWSGSETVSPDLAPGVLFIFIFLSGLVVWIFAQLALQKRVGREQPEGVVFEGLTRGPFLLFGGVALAAAIPGVLRIVGVLTFFMVGLPAYILGFAPMAFVCYLLSEVFFNFTKRFMSSGNWRWVVSIVSVIAILALASTALNFQTYKDISKLRATDQSITAPVELDDTIALLRQRGARGGSEISCDELCQRLLYNGAVKEVMVDEEIPKVANDLHKSIKVFSISKQKSCAASPNLIAGELWRGDAGYNKFGKKNAAVAMRIANGECLNQGTAPLSDAKMILAEWEVKKMAPEEHSRMRIGGDIEEARRIELIRNNEGKYETVSRKTQIEADVLITPLIIGPTGSFFSIYLAPYRQHISIDLFSDWRWLTTDVTVEYRRLFGNAVKLPVGLDIGSPDIMTLLGAALDKQTSPRDAGIQLFQAYLESFETKKVGTEADAVLIARAVADPRITNFQQMGWAIRALGPSASLLAKPMIDRILNAPPFGIGMVDALAMNISALPDGAAASIAPELTRLAHDPSHHRGTAWAAISRLRDAGPAIAVPVYKEIINLSPSAFRKEDYEDWEVVDGAMIGLCKMGADAKDAKEDLIRYVNNGIADRHYVYVDLALESLGHFLSEEEIRQEFLGKITPEDLDQKLHHSSFRGCAH